MILKKGDSLTIFLASLYYLRILIWVLIQFINGLVFNQYIEYTEICAYMIQHFKIHPSAMFEILKSLLYFHFHITGHSSPSCLSGVA